MADVLFKIVTEADSASVEKLEKQMTAATVAATRLAEALAQGGRNATQFIEPTAKLDAMFDRIASKANQGMTVTGGGLATDPAAFMAGGGDKDPAKKYHAAAQGAAEYKKTLEELRSPFKQNISASKEFWDTNEKGAGGAYGRMRAWRAAMYDVSTQIPMLNQAMTLMYYGISPQMIAIAGLATAAAYSVKTIREEFQKTNEVLNRHTQGQAVKGPLHGVGEAMVQAEVASKEWYQNLERALAVLERIHTVNQARLQSEQQLFEGQQKYRETIGVTGGAKSAIERFNAEVTVRRRKYAEAGRAEQAQESEIQKRLHSAGVPWWRTSVAELQGAASNAENEQRNLQENFRDAEAQITRQDEALQRVNDEINQSLNEFSDPTKLVKPSQAVLDQAVKMVGRGDIQRIEDLDNKRTMAGLWWSNVRLTGPIGAQVRTYIARLLKQKEASTGKAEATARREGYRGQMGPRATAVAQARMNLSDFQRLQTMTLEHQASAEERRIAEETAQKLEPTQLFERLMGTEEGQTSAEVITRIQNRIFETTRGGRALTADEYREAILIGSRIAGRKLSFQETKQMFLGSRGGQGAFPSMVNQLAGGAFGLVGAEERRRKLAEQHEQQPFMPIRPDVLDPDHRFAVAISNFEKAGREAMAVITTGVSTIGTVIEGVKTNQKLVMDKLKELDEATRANTSALVELNRSGNVR